MDAARSCSRLNTIPANTKNTSNPKRYAIRFPIAAPDRMCDTTHFEPTAVIRTQRQFVCAYLISRINYV